MQYIWKRADDKYSQAMRLFLGGVHVASVYWDPTARRAEEKKFRVSVSLPGAEKLLGRYFTEAEGMVKVERAVAQWLEKAGLEAKCEQS